MRGGAPGILKALQGDAVNRGIKSLVVHSMYILVHVCSLGSVWVVQGAADRINGCLDDAVFPSAACRNTVVSISADVARGWCSSLWLEYLWSGPACLLRCRHAGGKCTIIDLWWCWFDSWVPGDGLVAHIATGTDCIDRSGSLVRRNGFEGS